VPLGSITSSITSAIGDHGIEAVFLLMLLDAVFPAASELVMLYAGALAAGTFAGSEVVLFGHEIGSEGWALVAVIAAGTLGYTLGAVLGWAIGAFGGRPFLERHGRWLHLGGDRFARADRWFARWGDATAFVGRLTPVARSFVSVPAGVFELPLGRYTLLTFLGSTIWCTGFAVAGFLLGSSWERLHHDFRYVEYAIVIALVAGVGWLILKRRSRPAGRPAGRRAD
jgi:membrane protein DedA with SNARE-associated domain